MKYYTCTNPLCKFTFMRSGPVDRCEDCGCTKVREATEEEKNSLKEHIKEFGPARPSSSS